MGARVARYQAGPPRQSFAQAPEHRPHRRPRHLRHRSVGDGGQLGVLSSRGQAGLRRDRPGHQPRVADAHAVAERVAIAFAQPPAPTQDAFTVLLLGSDDDSKFFADHVLTQSMILVRVVPSTHSVTMLSIPRDLYVPLSTGGSGKID